MNLSATSIDWKPPLAEEPSSSSAAGNHVSDRELLRSYVAEGKEEVFTFLVQRHWSLVYGVAYRRVGNAALAQDIAQAVFIMLDRKCHSFSNGTILAGWLFRTSMFTANNALKAEMRRRERELQSTLEPATTEADAVQAWEVISKDLDEGLASLSVLDRDALILRYLQDRSFREVGQSLGLNENGARQRSLRALERLRRFLRKRGIVYPVGILALAFGVRPTHGAPPVTLSSAGAESLARETLALESWRRVRMVIAVGSILMIVALSLFFFVSHGIERNDSIARRRAIETVDRALWRGDGVRFAASISSGRTDPNEARRVLAAYASAFYGLRQSFDGRFGAGAEGWIGTMGALKLLAGDQIKEQPAINEKDHAINQIVPGYSMRLVREHGSWKWDLFENLKPAEAKMYLDEIARQTTIFERLRTEIDRSEFDRGMDLSRALRNEIMAHGRIESKGPPGRG